MTPDVNVLVAASRSDHPQHRPALAWLSGALADCESGGTIEILPMVAAGFLRLVTHSKVFIEPTPVAEAVAFLRAVMKVPGVEWISLGPEWPALEQLCLGKKLQGNAIPDAWIAAAVKARHGHLVTFDRDFSRLLERSELTLLAPL